MEHTVYILNVARWVYFCKWKNNDDDDDDDDDDKIVYFSVR